MAKSNDREKRKSDDFKSVRNAIRNNPLEKVYIIYGEEAYLRNKVIDEIANKRFKGGDIDPMSWEVYRSNEVGAQKVVDATRTISLFGGTKVVIYHDIDKLPIADIAILANYAANPVRAHLVLTATKLDSPARGASAKSTKAAKGAPSKTALWQQLANSARTYYFAPLIEKDYKPEISDFIKFTASEKKLRINSQAVEVLRDLIGPNLALIERAIEKLYIAYGSDRVITPDMVEEQVIDTRQRSVFELTKAISERDIVKAMAALHILLTQDQEPVAINGVLAMHARRLIAVKRAQKTGASDADIAKAAGISEHALDKEYNSAAEKYSLTELYQFHADIFDADRSLKSKPMPAELVFSRLLFNLIQKKPNEPRRVSQ